MVEYQHCQFLGCYSKPKDKHILIHDKEENNQINQQEACDVDGRQGSIWKIADCCKRPAGLPKSLKESETVTIFKKKLKTFLFGDYFNL